VECPHVGYRWKGPFNTYYFCMKHFLLNQIYTRVKFKNKHLLKRNLPTPVGSAERNFLIYLFAQRLFFWSFQHKLHKKFFWCIIVLILLIIWAQFRKKMRNAEKEKPACPRSGYQRRSRRVEVLSSRKIVKAPREGPMKFRIDMYLNNNNNNQNENFW